MLISATILFLSGCAEKPETPDMRAYKQQHDEFNKIASELRESFKASDEQLDRLMESIEDVSNIKKIKASRSADERTIRALKERLEDYPSKKMVATGYSLSYESCGKTPWHPTYGKTAIGTNARKSRTIAVDPKIIPLNTPVYIKFENQKYSWADGLYFAEDTGNAVKNNVVDIFFGTDDYDAGFNIKGFGRQPCDVYLIN